MGRKILVILIVVITLAGLALAGILPRIKKEKEVKEDSRALAAQVPGVLLTEAGQALDTLGLSIPGRIEAMKETQIFARAQGYVKSYSVDIGSQVRKGQSMAIIDQPELEQDIIAARTQADLARANLNRLEGVNIPGAIAPADLDNARAQLRSAQAQLARLLELRGFQKVDAPFDGVVTSRSLETGSFVSPGSGPLFTLTTDAKLRIFVDVPQSEAQAVRLDSGVATVRVPELANKAIRARIVRNTGTFDPNSRSLTVELHADANQGLVPGMYCNVFFRPSGALAGLVSIPENAVYIAPGGPSVVIYQPDGTVRQSRITIGRDRGSYVLASAGVKAGDKLVVNPNVRLKDGLKVEVLPDRGVQEQKKG